MEAYSFSKRVKEHKVDVVRTLRWLNALIDDENKAYTLNTELGRAAAKHAARRADQLAALLDELVAYEEDLPPRKLIKPIELKDRFQ